MNKKHRSIKLFSMSAIKTFTPTWLWKKYCRMHQLNDIKLHHQHSNALLITSPSSSPPALLEWRVTWRCSGSGAGTLVSTGYFKTSESSDVMSKVHSKLNPWNELLWRHQQAELTNPLPHPTRPSTHSDLNHRNYRHKVCILFMMTQDFCWWQSFTTPTSTQYIEERNSFESH